jgi:hypothetical protein
MKRNVGLFLGLIMLLSFGSLCDIYGDCDVPFVEENGILLAEAESVELTSNWKEDFFTPGHTGLSYIYHSGNGGELTYPIRINNPGVYRFQFRSKVGQGRVSSEHNDSFISFPDASDFYAVALDDNAIVRQEKFKAYSAAPLDWTWVTYTVDHDPHIFYVKFDTAGVYTFILEGRSSYHFVDRFVLYNEDYTEEEATDPERKTTTCGILDTMNFAMEDFFLDPNGFLANEEAVINFKVPVTEFEENAIKEVMVDLTSIGRDTLYLSRFDDYFGGTIVLDSMPSNSKEIAAIVKNYLGHGKALTSFIALNNIIPGIIEGERFSEALGVLTRQDTPLKDFLGWTDPQDWVVYYLDAPVEGKYTVVFYMATMLDNVDISIDLNNSTINNITIPSTGGWRTFDTVSINVQLNEGKNMLKLTSNADAWNLSHLMAEKTDQMVFLNDIDIHNELLDTVKLADEIKLNPVFYPENASFKKVEWYSNNPTVINVSQDGTLKINRAGKATISLTTYDNLISNAITLVVEDNASSISDQSPKTGITVSPTLLKVGETIHISLENNISDRARLTIIDIHGRIFKTTEFEDLADNLKIVPNLNPGLYILCIEVSDFRENIRIVIH